MKKLIGPNGQEITKGETETDRIINAFYCGQIQALHHLIYFLWRSKRKYRIDDIFRFIDSRYCYLIKEYPNYYNTLTKAEAELDANGEANASYHTLFEEMLKHFKNVAERKPKF